MISWYILNNILFEFAISTEVDIVIPRNHSIIVLSHRQVLMEGGRGDGKRGDRGERGNDMGDGRNYSIIVLLHIVIRV